MRPDIAGLIEQLTLEEQVSLLAGADFWQTVAIERLSIPSMKVTDGPNGARGAGAFTSGVPAASFPVGISLASTWDVNLVAEIGTALAEEAKTKAARLMLAPTVNLHRSPLGGRNFESFAEDPWLAGMLGAAYVSALQQEGIAAALKHYAGNESEFERMSIDSRISERALRELYLRPFEIVVRQAKPWSVMAAYNKLNGTYASENSRLLKEILRKEWGFDGLVMSDWTGTRSTAGAVNAGLDLEMPGPAEHRGQKLVDAAMRGEANRSAIAASAGRVLQLVDRVNGFDNPEIGEEQAVNEPRHRALIRRAGAQGIVLLTNNGVLPLDCSTLKSIAVIGPNAAEAQIMGGGSSQINAHYRISPLEGIRSAVSDDTAVQWATGCHNFRLLPPLRSPARIDYFTNVDLDGEPALSQLRDDTDIMWLGGIDPGVDFSSFSIRMTTEFTADRADEYGIGVVSSGPVRVLADGELVLDQWEDWQPGGEYFGLASAEYRGAIHLQPGLPHTIVVENRTSRDKFDFGLKALRLGIARPDGDEDLAEAVRLATEAQTAVVFVGLSGEWDTEGMDRPHMDLPGRQNELVSRVAAANPNTVVVLQSGGPVTMPWLQDVSAVLQAWYPGQECGNAVADILFGSANPSGKLPQTFPKNLAQNPTSLSYPGERGVARYGEDIFCGYRFYDRTATEPLFPFGYGLSYTQFAYGQLRLPKGEVEPGEANSLEIDITNKGQRSGAEVVQLYIRDIETTLMRPEKELKGFGRVELAPGESGTVRFDLDMRSLAYFDDARNAWVADAGEFEIQIGASSTDIRATASLILAGEWVESVKDAWRSDHV